MPKSEETFELVRGKDDSFTLTVENPYTEISLVNVRATVTGYLAQYIKILPAIINEILPGESADFTIIITAPAYLTKGDHELVFTITSTKQKKNVKESMTEKRYITLAVHELSGEEAAGLLNDSVSNLETLEELDLNVEKMQELLDEAEKALKDGDYEKVKQIQEEMQQIKEDAVETNNVISTLSEKLNEAEASGVKTPQTSRLLALAKAAASRGDYETALARVKEAELTYAVETKGEFNIWFFIARNSIEVAIGTLIFLALAILLSLRARLFLINNELNGLQKEEDVLLGLIRVVQKECFVEKKMSMAEYNQAILQYENRLGKAVNRTVELESIKANLMKFKKETERLKSERKRILDLMKETQQKYLVGGMIETRIYYNKMHSFSTRLSEIEEKIALNEARVALKTGKRKSPIKGIKEKARKRTEAKARLKKRKKLEKHFLKMARKAEKERARKIKQAEKLRKEKKKQEK